MKFTSSSFENGAKIPGEFAFGVPDAKTHVALSKNRNPAFAWRGAPAATRSFALVCHDSDVPSQGDDVNQEGRSVPPTLPRVDFYHWVLVDLRANSASIEAGEFSDGVTPRGKQGPSGPRGTRQGINDYTGWFASDKDMAGDYFGYDGPCPPWNDTIPHHYVFTLYALDCEKCPVTGTFSGPDVLAAILGRVLAQVSMTGIYSLNPQVKI